MSASLDSVKPLPIKNDSESQELYIVECAEAWLACQKEIRNPLESEPGQYGKFASLEDQLELYRPLLNKHGFTLRQTIQEGTSRDLMMTIAEHAKSGECYSSSCPMPTHQDPQKYGGNITYFRRYSLDMLLGVQGTKDDGGDGPSDHDRPTPLTLTNTQARPALKKEEPRSIDSEKNQENYDTAAHQMKWSFCEHANYEIPMGYLKGEKIYKIKETVLFSTQMYYTKNPKNGSAAFVETIKQHLASRKDAK